MKKILFPTVLATLMTACNSAPDYDATGIFEATTVTVSAETSGKILSFPISEGDSVIAGQRLAVIDTAMLVLQQRQLNSLRQSTEKRVTRYCGTGCRTAFANLPPTTGM